MTDCHLQPCMYEGYNNYIKQFMARKLWCKKKKYLLQLKTIYFFSFFYFMSSELWTKNKQADQGYIVHKVVQCNSMRRNNIIIIIEKSWTSQLEHLNIDVILPHLLPDEEKNESHLFGLQWFSAIKNNKER